jgi:hypothetical protein
MEERLCIYTAQEGHGVEIGRSGVNADVASAGIAASGGIAAVVIAVVISVSLPPAGGTSAIRPSRKLGNFQMP